MSLNLDYHRKDLRSLIEYVESAEKEHIVNFADLEERYCEVYGKIIDMLKHLSRRHRTSDGQELAIQATHVANTYFVELNALREHTQTTLIRCM